MVTSTNLGYLGSYFLKKKYIEAKSIWWYSAYSRFPYIKSEYRYVGVGVKGTYVSKDDPEC